MILILAGHANQAIDYVFSRGLTRKEWRYVADAYSLRGITGTLVRTGNWWTRDDIDEIERELRDVAHRIKEAPCTVSSERRAGKSSLRDRLVEEALKEVEGIPVSLLPALHLSRTLAAEVRRLRKLLRIKSK